MLLFYKKDNKNVINGESMTLKHLKIFVAVYQYMNVTKAAKELHMAQPSVTRSVQELEMYYGIRLFDRFNHRLYRTVCADELYARAVHILESVQELDNIIRNRSELEELHIGGTMTMGSFILPEVISEFHKIRPTVQVSVEVSKSSDIQQGILDNRLDLALIEENVNNEYLEKEYLCTDYMCLIFPKEHPLAKKKRICMNDIAQYPMLLREKGSASRAYLEHVFALHDMEVKPVWESASSQALINAVAQGIGISILPEKLVQRDLLDGRIASGKLQDEELKRKAYLIWHRQKNMSEELKKLKELCKTMVEGKK